MPWAPFAVAADAPPPPAPLPIHTPAATAAWRAAGDTLRRGECAEAQAGVTSESPTAILLQGLYAYTCDQPRRARDLLVSVGGGDSSFEDWRLLILAESAAADGDWSSARATYERLLAQHPASPARRVALLRALERARQVADADFVFALARHARAEALDADRLRDREWAVAVETIAWEVAGRTRRASERRSAGHRLLALDPVRAEKLAVAERLHVETGEPPRLPPALLRLRGERLLRLDRDGEALDVLETIPSSFRDFRWYELAARALIATERGAEATALLSSRAPTSPDQRARLAWQRARALREAATVRSGRTNPALAEREELLRQARQELRTAARQRSGDASRRALRRLFFDLAEEESYDEALVVLRELRRLDPDDRTGVDTLWQRGWVAYRSGDPTAAVGYWAELQDIYPDSRVRRQARYWTARALERLGRQQRGQEIYAELAAADSADFYRRQALARLPAADRETLRPAVAAERPWPTDPLLERARFLTDVGLDDLALEELRALAARSDEGPDEDAAAALEALVLSRLDEPRAGIGRILRAYRELGTAHQDSAPRLARELYYPLTFSDSIRRSAEQANLPLSLVLGMVRQESGFDRVAVSRAGARGLMQLMPATAREVAGRLQLRFATDRLEDPSYNTRLGTTYFRQVLDMFDGNVELALAGYNGGPYRIRRLWREAHEGGRSPELDEFLEGLPVSESRAYVKRILLLSDSYRRLYDLES